MNPTQFEKLIPATTNEGIDWSGLEDFFATCGYTDMASTPQNPVFHAEGDVLTHTKLVCRELQEMDAFQSLPGRQRTEVFLAALFHDIGEMLWRDFGLCAEAMAFRENVCALVRYHMLPVHLLNQEEPERKARQVAALGELMPDFSWELLCLLAEADVKGRIADDIEAGLEQVHLARLLAEESGCLSGPYPFSGSYTKRAYLSGRKVQHDQPLYDDAWGEVLLLSGLPGTGKDTWIRQNAPELPMISLDDIRREFGAAASGEQAKVIHTAQERARMLLRSKQSFVWNATNITPEIRAEQVGLFERYGARVRVVYLEAPWETELARNEGRCEKVPQAAIENLLAKTVPPMPDEAQTVEWYCV